MKKEILKILLVLICTHSYAQLKKYRWGEGCLYEGIYDEREITKEQIKDTYRLCFTNISFLQTSSYAWSPEEIQNLSLVELDKEFTIKRLVIEKLNIAKSPYWEKVKKSQLDYLRQFFLVKKISILSYKDPSILQTLNYRQPCEYLQAIIEGGEKMYKVWKIMAEEHCKSNGDPKKCFEDMYLNKFNSPQCEAYGKIEIMLFGWGNHCATTVMPSLVPYSELNSQFNKLFKEVKNLGCEDY